MNHLNIRQEAPCYDTVRAYLEDAVKKFGEHNAFVLKESPEHSPYYRPVSYRRFWEEIRAFGAGLCHLGLQGKRIALIGKNGYEWILSFLSVLCGVGVIVPLDKELPEKELRLSLERSQADAVIFDEERCDFFFGRTPYENPYLRTRISLKKVRADVPSVRDTMELGFLALKNENRFDAYSPDPDEMAALLFTSGTTSASKAVMLSRRNIATNLYDLMRVETITPEDRNLVFLPLHHTFGSVGLTYFLCCGATNMFCDGLRYVQKNLKEYRVTTFVGVPLLLEAMYRTLQRGIEKKGKTKALENAKKISRNLQKMGIDARRKLFSAIHKELGGCLRFIISGASALDREVAEGFNEIGILTVQGYGLTETSPVLSAENNENRRLGSVGLPFPSVEITICDPDENGIGEICAKGGNVMLGYYEMPKETEEVLKDGVFHTGDLGYLDEDGFLYITGRKKNVIVLKNGKNVYPEELEEGINRLPFVKESMVYAGERDGARLIAAKIVYDEEYFAAKENMTEEEKFTLMKEAVSSLNEALPSYKHVKQLTFRTEPFIKTSTAKIRRHEEMD